MRLFVDIKIIRLMFSIAVTASLFITLPVSAMSKPFVPMTVTFSSTAISPSKVPPLPKAGDVSAVNGWLFRMALLSSRLSIRVLGTSEDGRAILGVVAGADTKFDRSMPTVAIICRQHGDEPAPTLAALTLITQVAVTKSPRACAVLQRVRYFIVPISSPDGAVDGRRFVHDGQNLNRDWGVFRLPETRAINAALQRLRPQALLDCHELLPGDYQTFPYLECDSSGGALAASIQRAVSTHNAPLAVGHTTPDCPSTLLYRYFESAYGHPAIMLESALVGDNHLQNRIHLHTAAAWAAAEYVVGYFPPCVYRQPVLFRGKR